ncbi:coiled-coil domain-containing protein 12 [Citrus sinensis]|uniref:Coiled-coil domain-containing protein 12 n=1 Tax=Citrus sinensis TaxID=2711 RepID=A0ACB8M696_CITSI|nr:coiled-coil domain-containing protein 12 [Citrus sinensis]
MGTEEEVSVEQAAAARRERLKALRAAQELLSAGDDDSGQADDNNKATDDDDDDDNDNEDAEDINLSMKFRNYVPHDKQLQEGKVTPPELPKFEDPVAAAPPQSEKKEDPFVNIAPKKPNWDLRRDVQKKLDKLESRTQKAMFTLMQQQEKEKLTAENEEGSRMED